MYKFKFFLTIFVVTFVAFGAGWLASIYSPKLLKKNPEIKVSLITEKPLEKYSIENLSNNTLKPGKISFGDTLSEENNFSSYLFSFEFNPNLDEKTIKKTTGIINVPIGKGPFPMAILIRGFVDQKIYTSGIGTKRVGEYLAKNGFITIAPDFLGYAGSDKESENIFESRFQTYTTILSLIKTLESLSNDITLISGDGEVTQKVIDHISLSLWGHSNGGQIALTVLEITKKPYPTVLWAPVSKPFPYSILYYTDESEDKGKFIREKLAEFEKDYDVEKYSLDNYLSEISAPIQIHQGFVDNAVPLDWSKTLFNRLGKLYEERKDTNKLEFFLNIRGLIII